MVSKYSVYDHIKHEEQEVIFIQRTYFEPSVSNIVIILKRHQKLSGFDILQFQPLCSDNLFENTSGCKKDKREIKIEVYTIMT